MPLYEYRCKTCGHQFEIQQSISDDNLTVCPDCEGELRKVFSPVGITFKGSGFYKNDSRGSSSSTTPSGESSSSGDQGGGDSKNSESKSDSSTGSDAKTSKPNSDSSTSTSTASKD